YDNHVWGIQPGYSQDQVGAVSLLARMEIAGLDVGNRWQQLAEYLRPRAADTIQPFLTLQYLYGLARADFAEADRLMQAVEDKAQSSYAFDRLVWRDVALPAARGVLAHARRNWFDAARYLGIANPRMTEIGGSHAQRDLFGQMHLDALTRAGALADAQDVLQRQLRAQPESLRLKRQARPLYAALGLAQLAP
ncbi:MAG: tetratricopeptide repeat protein, partial [Ramlibacter sp.]|nr:tetratricopeptide repeat protein [Ramlibacter sp.]